MRVRFYTAQRHVQIRLQRPGVQGLGNELKRPILQGNLFLAIVTIGVMQTTDCLVDLFQALLLKFLQFYIHFQHKHQNIYIYIYHLLII